MVLYASETKPITKTYEKKLALFERENVTINF